ncbi:cuticle protein AMP1A-like [Penaeus vannamei]|uniref:cuticle protein AMP1A-like n=1 Tax=Penaeus vannamei TaxID=6689 RepID=UPI00387FA8F0
MTASTCFVVLAGVVAMAAAQGYSGGGGGGGSGGGRQFISIVKDDRTQNAYGENTFEFVAANGIVRYESGKENNGHVQEGGWRYQAPEGIPVEITFVADQGGYQPQGDLLPVAPPLPYQRTQSFGGAAGGGGGGGGYT